MRIFSWNVNGLRAVLRKGALQEFIAAEKPDILCLQETKAKPGQAEFDLPEYQEIWNSATRPGYSGTAIFSKIKPLSTSANFDITDSKSSGSSDGFIVSKLSSGSADGLNASSGLVDGSDLSAGFSDQFGDILAEGRILTAEFDDFYLVNLYVPNSKPNLERLSLRERVWDPAILKYLKQLEKSKPVVVCGDLNVAHNDIDLARPKTNHHNAGFTDQERQGFENYMRAGLIDTFRTLHPDEVRYTWWSHWGNARANNVGWRIDYFLISESLLSRLKSADIYENYLGSDHCPISITLQ